MSVDDERSWVLILRDPIPADKWQALVAADPGLEPVDFISGRNPVSGDLIRIPQPHSARWTGGPPDLHVVFVYDKKSMVGAGVHYPEDRGTISTALHEPHAAVVEKLTQMAEALGTEVDGSVWPPATLRLLSSHPGAVDPLRLFEVLEPALDLQDRAAAAREIPAIAAAVSRGEPVELPWPVDEYYTPWLTALGVRFDTRTYVFEDDAEDADG